MSLDSASPCPCNSFRYQTLASPVNLALGDPGDWMHIVTVPFNILTEEQIAKIEVNMQVLWDSIDQAYSELDIEYRLLRNGRQITIDDTIFAYDVDEHAIHQETLSFFYVDSPGKGAFTYTLQARISSYLHVEGPLKINKADMTVNIFNSVATSSNLYVTYTSAEDSKGYVAVVNPQTKQVVGNIPVGMDPRAIAKSPDGATVYVVNHGDETLSVIDVSTSQVTDTLSLGSNPVAIVVTPDNRETYVANYDSKTITVIDNSSHALTTIDFYGNPFSLTVDAKSWFVIVACKGGASSSDTYLAINTTHHTVQSGTINWSSDEHNPIAMTTDGKWVALFGADNIVVWNISGPNSLSYHYTWGVGGSMAAVGTDSGQWHDVFYAIQGGSSTQVMRAGISSGFAGPYFTSSYKGQNDIAVSPDYQKVCVIIEASDDQFAGLQIIEPFNDQHSSFVRMPVAHQVVITPDSLQAYITEEQYVTPVDLVTYTKGEAIFIAGKVYGMALSYVTQSKLRPKTQVLEEED